MPSPRSNESRDAFIERCMGDEEAVRDYPDADQRYAVCTSFWDNRKKAEGPIRYDRLFPRK